MSTFYFKVQEPGQKQEFVDSRFTIHMAMVEKIEAGPYPLLLSLLQNHNDFMGGNSALAQNLPAARA
jgi:hypothetical protein